MENCWTRSTCFAGQFPIVQQILDSSKLFALADFKISAAALFAYKKKVLSDASKSG